MSSPVIEISELLKGYFPRTAFLQAILSFYTWVSLVNLKSGYLVSIHAEDFYLEVGVLDDTLILTRNGYTAKLPLAQNITPNIAEKVGLENPCLIMFLWEPTRIAVFVNFEHNEVMTEPTIPPYSLLEWARRQAILPIIRYESRRHFRDTILNGLVGLQDKIERINNQSAFWDFTYNGSSIVERLPKKEPHIHPIIHGLLHDFAIAKNIEMYPEATVGSGDLDFLFTGTLESGQTVKACVEFKHAHSADLEKGLIDQLPAYMRTCATDIGFYCISWYKGKYFSKPSKTLDEVRGELICKVSEAGLKSITVILIDVSGGTPPSS